MFAHVLAFYIVHGNDQKGNLSNNGEEHYNLAKILEHDEVDCAYSILKS